MLHKSYPMFVLAVVIICVDLGISLRQASAAEEIVCEDEHRAFIAFRKGMPFDPSYSPDSDILPVRLPRGAVTLEGYMAKARNHNGKAVAPEGFIVVLPGNQMYAQHLVGEARFLSKFGFDVYVYDYRGYGLSNGETTVQHLIDDAKAVVAHLSGKTDRAPNGSYKSRHVYGISMGGAVAINAFSDISSSIDRVVLDGTPASASLKLGWLPCFLTSYCMACPSRLDPLNASYQFGARSLLIHGGNDKVLRWTQGAGQQRQLLERARASGVCVSEQPEFGHPLRDGYTVERLLIVGRFLNWQSDKQCPNVPQIRKHFR